MKPLFVSTRETGYRLSHQPDVSSEMMQETCLKGFSAKKGAIPSKPQF